jgi:glycoside/pentoside/hexuronide:cation symporter, GPH family
MTDVRRLSQPTMLAFGIGQAAEGMKNQAFAVFLVFYYQQVIGLPGWMAGLALGIALVFDAVTDPLAGVISDRTQTRWGRRHPFMFASALPFFFAFVALFSPPDGLGDWGYFAWLVVFAVGVRGALTLFHVPHLALGAEMAQDYHQRSTLYAYSTVFSITAAAVVSFIGYRFFFPTTPEFSPGTLNPAGYGAFGLFFGTGVVLMILVCCFGTRKEIPFLRQVKVETALSFSSAWKEFRDVFANRSYRLIFIGMLISTFAVAVDGVLSPYMGVHFWGLTTESLSLIAFATLLGIWIGLPLAPVITRKLDKRRALVIPAVIVVLNANLALVPRLLDVSWFPENGSIAIFWIYFAKYFIQGLCLPAIFSSFNSMFADIADEVELQSGGRREGVIFSSRSFATKLTGAAGALVGGIMIDLIRFPVGAVAGTVPAETVWWLGFLEGPCVYALSLTGVLFYLRYEIDAKRHAEIRMLLDQRAAAR